MQARPGQGLAIGVDVGGSSLKGGLVDVRGGHTWTAANVDASWVGAAVDHVFADALARGVHVLNDADAAGLAEARFGSAAGEPGLVLVLTFGTGIGSALIADGRLVPGLELGHLELGGSVAEHRASARVIRAEGLSWSAWALRVQTYLRHVGRVLNPDLVVVGGAVSELASEWLPLIEVSFPMRAAVCGNDAGVIGAAVAASERHAGPASSGDGRTTPGP